VTLPSRIYDKIWKAVRQHRMIDFYHGGKRRVAVPIVLGYSGDGREALMAYQVGGQTSPGGKLPGWRCFYLAGARDVKLLTKSDFAGDSHKQPQACVQFVDVDANIPDTLTREKPLPLGSPKLKPPRNEKRRPSFRRKKRKTLKAISTKRPALACCPASS
jgi:hypothetical protein